MRHRRQASSDTSDDSRETTDGSDDDKIGPARQPPAKTVPITYVWLLLGLLGVAVVAVVVIWQMRAGREAATEPSAVQASPVQLNSEAPAETASLGGNTAGAEEVRTFFIPKSPESLLKSSAQTDTSPRPGKNGEDVGGGEMTCQALDCTKNRSQRPSAAPTQAGSSSAPKKTASPNDTKGPYKLVRSYEGETFFDGWEFFSLEDPTEGQVNYLKKDAAQKAGLFSATAESAMMVGSAHLPAS